MLIVHGASHCDVCLEKYDFFNPGSGIWPWAISCGHVFCENCLRTVNPKICPLCRKHFDSQRIKKLIVDAPPEDAHAQQYGEYVAHMETLSLVVPGNTPADQVQPTVASVRAWLEEQPPDSHLPLRRLLASVTDNRALFRRVPQLEADLEDHRMRGNKYKNQRDHERVVAAAVERGMSDQSGQREAALLDRVHELERLLAQHSIEIGPALESNPLPHAPRPPGERRHSAYPDVPLAGPSNSASHAVNERGRAAFRDPPPPPSVSSDGDDGPEARQRARRELQNFDAERMTATVSRDRPHLPYHRTEPLSSNTALNIDLYHPNHPRDRAAEEEARLHDERVRAYQFGRDPPTHNTLAVDNLASNSAAQITPGTVMSGVSSLSSLSGLGGVQTFPGVAPHHVREETRSNWTLSSWGTPSSSTMLNIAGSSTDARRGSETGTGAVHPPLSTIASSSPAHSLTEVEEGRGRGPSNPASVHGHSSGHSSQYHSAHASQSNSPTNLQASSNHHSHSASPAYGLGLDPGPRAHSDDEGEGELNPEIVDTRIPPMWEQYGYVQRTELDHQNLEKMSSILAVVDGGEDRETTEERTARQHRERKEQRRADKLRGMTVEERAQYEASRAAKGKGRADAGHPPVGQRSGVNEPSGSRAFPAGHPAPNFGFNAQPEQSQHQHRHRERQAHSHSPPDDIAIIGPPQHDPNVERRRQRRQTVQYPLPVTPHHTAVSIAHPPANVDDDPEYFPAPGPSTHASPTGSAYAALPPTMITTPSLGQTAMQMTGYTPSWTQAQMAFTPAVTHASLSSYSTPAMSYSQVHPPMYQGVHTHRPLPSSATRQPPPAQQAMYAPSTYADYHNNAVANGVPVIPAATSTSQALHPATSGGERRTRVRTNSQPPPPQFPPGSYAAPPQMGSRSVSYTVHGGPYPNVNAGQGPPGWSS